MPPRNHTPRASSTRFRIAAVGVVLALLVGPITAFAAAIPAQLRAAILIRALRYEQSFAAGTSAVNLVVVGHSSSASDAQAMSGLFNQLARTGAAGRPLTIRSLVVDNDGAALAQVQAASPKVVYVAQGSESMLPRLAGLPSGTLVLCADGASIGTGCLLSVEQSGSQSRLVVDLGRSTRAGLSFDARMLRLARVVR